MDKSNKIENGLIVSIQGYSLNTTQELAEWAINGGAVAIRTDQPIKIKVPVIGLQKIENKEFYITSTREALIEVQKWADYIAIDSRKGNQDLSLLYAHCHVNNIKYIADIQYIDDVKNILEMCSKKKIIKPSFFATTFSYNGYLVKQIKEITDIPIIAEGGYNDKIMIYNARLNGASNVCIGTAISNIMALTYKHRSMWEGNLCY